MGIGREDRCAGTTQCRPALSMTCRIKGRYAETIQRSVEPSLADVPLDDGKPGVAASPSPPAISFRDLIRGRWSDAQETTAAGSVGASELVSLRKNFLPKKFSCPKFRGSGPRSSNR